MIPTITTNVNPASSRILTANMPNYARPDAKIERMAKRGELLRLRRDLYFNPRHGTIDTFFLANQMLTPSYVSGLSALWHYGIIPEYVFDTISMTTGRSRIYKNELGTFRYVRCTDEYFHIGVQHIKRSGNTILLAGKEKALSDLIMMTPNLNLRYRKETMIWMRDEMRMDMDELSDMNLDILKQCAEHGKKVMLKTIIKIFR